MFLNFNSLTFKLATLLTLLLWVINLTQGSYVARSVAGMSFLILSAAEAFVAFFAHFPWYRGPYRGLGIEEHFRKMFAFSLYPFLVANLFFALWGPLLILNLILVLLLIFVLVINSLLLSYHFRDPDKTPPAYFAAGLYLSCPVLLFFLLVPHGLWAAKPDAWLGQNRFEIENIKISRPNAHWRVLNNVDSEGPPCLIQFRYNKFKSNVNIDLCRHPEITIKRRWNDKMAQRDQKILLKILLAPYHNEGYQFFKTDLKRKSLKAQGVNKNNEIIFLHYQFAPDRKFHNPVVVEMKIPRNDYLEFNPAFETVADSLVVE